MITDPLEAIDKALDFADDSFESRQEAEEMRTKRHELDMTSPFKLPQLIRPISFIWTLANETILTWATIAIAFFVDEPDPTAVNALLTALGANTTLLMTIVGFYFNSRKGEKITAKKAQTALEIEEMKTKAEIREARREARHQRRLERKSGSLSNPAFIGQEQKKGDD